MTTRRAGWVILLAAVMTVAGCGDATTGEVSGQVTVDGETPPAGSSISFIPENGTAAVAGCLIEDGRYHTRVPVGAARVEIRVPRVLGKPKVRKGDYQTEGEIVEESLPAKYHEKSELRFEVRPGANEKDWDLTTK